MTLIEISIGPLTGQEREHIRRMPNPYGKRFVKPEFINDGIRCGRLVLTPVLKALHQLGIYPEKGRLLNRYGYTRSTLLFGTTQHNASHIEVKTETPPEPTPPIQIEQPLIISNLLEITTVLDPNQVTYENSLLELCERNQKRADAVGFAADLVCELLNEHKPDPNVTLKPWHFVEFKEAKTGIGHDVTLRRLNKKNPPMAAGIWGFIQGMERGRAPTCGVRLVDSIAQTLEKPSLINSMFELAKPDPQSTDSWNMANPQISI